MKTKVQIYKDIDKPYTVTKSDCCCLLNYPPIRLYVFFLNGAIVRIIFDKKEAKFSLNNIPEKTPPPLLKHEMDQYFGGVLVRFTSPTRFLEGTDFQRDIWEALIKIPLGKTRTYGWLARQAGHPEAARAVGNALGKNPIPLIFPCHRIILSSGGMGGYSSGTHIKSFLLELEKGGKSIL